MRHICILFSKFSWLACFRGSLKRKVKSGAATAIQNLALCTQVEPDALRPIWSQRSLSNTSKNFIPRKPVAIYTDLYSMLNIRLCFCAQAMRKNYLILWNSVQLALVCRMSKTSCNFNKLCMIRKIQHTKTSIARNLQMPWSRKRTLEKNEIE